MKDLRTSLVSLALFTVLLGFAYPAVMTVVAHTAFPHQAAGSPIVEGGRIIGSELLGQSVTNPAYLWGRPSATAPVADNAMASGASNAGPLSPALADAVKQRIAALRAADPTATGAVPIDLVTASASGLDPDVSPQAAYFQAARIARARNVPESAVRELIAAHVEGPQLGLLGDARVNVLAVDRALDARLGPPR